MRTLIDTQLERTAIEHYLFDLGYSVEKVSEIFDMSEAHVKDVYEARARLTIPQRSNE